MGVLLFFISLFIFVFIYGCQLRDVTLQSEALFGLKVNSSTTNATELFSRQKLTIFCAVVQSDLAESIPFNFAGNWRKTPCYLGWCRQSSNWCDSLHSLIFLSRRHYKGKRVLGSHHQQATECLSWLNFLFQKNRKVLESVQKQRMLKRNLENLLNGFLVFYISQSKVKLPFLLLFTPRSLLLLFMAWRLEKSKVLVNIFSGNTCYMNRRDLP